jgi:hypothetical protein
MASSTTHCKEATTALLPLMSWFVVGWLSCSFSTRHTTKIPAASGKKQSNYYRSAYEVGKVVIQALQEYSLLPIYSVSSPTGNDTPWAAITSRSPFPNDAITGVSKLSDGVPRLKKI